jgi:hypothetical protein
MTRLRGEIDTAFRHFYSTGPIHGDWASWADSFTADAKYHDPHRGAAVGPEAIRELVGWSLAGSIPVYSPLVWYAADGNRVAFRSVHRADRPDGGGIAAEFTSTTILTYAGGGRWSDMDCWWLLPERKKFVREYLRAREQPGPVPDPAVPRDWGPWVDWARPGPDTRR